MWFNIQSETDRCCHSVFHALSNLETNGKNNKAMLSHENHELPLAIYHTPYFTWSFTMIRSKNIDACLPPGIWAIVV